MKKILFALLSSLTILSSSAMAADYKIDTSGMHAFVQFRVKHLGYSWLYGRFNEFSGQFSYDQANPNASKVAIDIDMASVDSNHAERDKHIRGDDFLDTDEHPKATFISTTYKTNGGNTAELMGDLTFNGVTKPVKLEVAYIGGGNDPWGGFRQGFEGRTTIKPADFGVDLAKKLGPSAIEVELILSIEGVRL